MSDTNQNENTTDVKNENTTDVKNENTTDVKNENDISEFSDIPEDNYVYNSKSNSNEPSKLSKAFWFCVVVLCIMIVFAGFMAVTQLVLKNNTTETAEITEITVEENSNDQDGDEEDTEMEKEDNLE